MTRLWNISRGQKKISEIFKKNQTKNFLTKLPFRAEKKQFFDSKLFREWRFWKEIRTILKQISAQMQFQTDTSLERPLPGSYKLLYYIYITIIWLYKIHPTPHPFYAKLQSRQLSLTPTLSHWTREFNRLLNRCC